MTKKRWAESACRCASRGRGDATARGPQRPVLRPLMAAMAACSSWGIALPADAQLPVGPTVVSGSASVGTAGGRMTVTNSPNAIVDWQSFSIGAGNGVRFQQQSAASQILNRVTGNDASQILGSLSSNGRVWLINPHGVLFGQNARIDVAGLVASTLAISNADFLGGRFNFAAGGENKGVVTNQGDIRTSFGGRVWLLGDQVRNEGLVQAPGGDIVLAAGKSVELVDSGLPNVVVRVTAPENVAANLGTLVADGGRIDLHGGIVNQDGIVRADRIGADAAGRVVLKAAGSVILGESSATQATGGIVRVEADDTVNNRGEISASDIALAANHLLQQGRIAAPGGNVTMTAGAATYLDGTVDVSDAKGQGGGIRLATGKLEGMAGGSLRADGRQGGSIEVTGRGMVAFSSTLSATGLETGGRIEVTGDSVYLLNAEVDASGGVRGGTVHLGGGWQGTGALAHAREVLVGVGSEVRANGASGGQGGGGEVVVWSTQSSEHHGTLQARDGGRIELSSQGEIRQTGSLQAGADGSVLFDPKNLVITDSPPDSVVLARKVTSGSVGSAQPVLADGDFLGGAVALDGDRLAVGAPGDNTGGFQAGAVHLFTGVGGDFSGLTWRKKLASGTGAFGMPTLTHDDYFGSAVALSGDRLAVGAPFDDTGSSSPSADRGAVHLFTGVGTNFAGLTWRKKLASATGAGGMPGLADVDLFGYGVALDGDRLAVGAPGDSTGGTGFGAVHLFTGTGSDFSGLVRQGKVASSTGAIGMPRLSGANAFGVSVALDGDRLVVGAPYDSTGGFTRGAVHLFNGVGADFSGLRWRSSIDSGSFPSTLLLNDEDRFGWSVALRGDRLAVGAPGDDTGGIDRGAVHLFNVFSGAGADFSALGWQSKLASGTGPTGMPALADGGRFGMSVALDGDRMAVGARQDNTGGTSRGAVYLFNGAAASALPPPLVWQRKLASGTGTGGMPALAAGDLFGNAVALDGDRLAVGAPFDDTAGLDRGAVHLFTGAGTSFSGLTWQKKLSSGTGAASMPALADSDLFGAALALDGDKLAVGAPYDDTGGANRGAVHLFTGVGTDFSGLAWQRKVASGTGAAGMRVLADNDQFGNAVALNGDRLAIGAFADDSGGLNQGAVHLFTGVGTDFSGLAWQKKLISGSGALNMPALTGNDQFGFAVALDGDRLAVGAPSDPSGGGAVHLFTGVGTDFSGLVWQKKLASGSGASGMPALASGDQFGSAVALSGDRLAVGAPQDDTGGTDRGALHLFTGVGTNFSGLFWQGKVASGTGASGMAALADNDQFGFSVALNGGRLAVGARHDDSGGSDAGAVYLFNGFSTLASGAISVGDATFTGNAAGTSFITPFTIRSLLDAGTAVTLQANNDITVQSAINADNTSGNGGNLVLQAGRNVNFLANVTTDNGSIAVIAGDAGANTTFRDPGTPTLTLASSVTLNVGTGTATLAAVGGNFVNNAGNSAISTTGAGRWLIYSADPAGTTEGFSSFNKHYDQPFTPGSPPLYAGSGNWFLYGIAPTLSVTPGNRSVVYGSATPSFSPGYAGFIDGDTSATAGLAGAATWNVGGTKSSSGAPTVGSHDVAYAGGVASSLGYRLADNAASGNELSVSAKALTASYTAGNKTYDGTTAATVAGTSSDIVPGDAVGFSQTAAFRDKNAGSAKTVDVAAIALGGADEGNYALQNSSATATANIAQKPLTPALVGTASKVYDGTAAATLGAGNVAVAGVVPGDAVGVNVTGAAYDSRNAGVGKAVSVAGVSLTGADAANYSITRPAASNIGTVTPAPLTYVADAKTGAVGAPLPSLTGTVTGFIGTETQADSTSGTLAWTTPATPASSLAGRYPIEGSGLSAANYTFSQAPSNATALTLVLTNSPESPPQKSAGTTLPGVEAAIRAALPTLDPASIGAGVSDRAAVMMSPMASSFDAVNLALMSRDEMQQLLDSRKEFMRKLLFNAIFKLEQDPSLAEVRPCPSLADADSGLCMMTADQRAQSQSSQKADAQKNKPRVKLATLPQIERKVIVLFGINRYADPTIPPLENAVPDAEVVGKLFAEKLGYEARVVKNATKADIFRTLNQLAAEVDANDSVIVYYAGHGYLDEKTGAGYWVPSDGSSSDPARWVSNADISKMLAEIRAKQVAMISDSCYSGAFTKEEKIASGGKGITPSEVLTKRSVVVMSSGGDEPVADTGKGGHSIFAWQLMQALRNVENWQPGTNVFERVQREVSKSFPQTPQYGAAASAGHQAGGEYLFEVRQLEETRN